MFSLCDKMIAKNKLKPHRKLFGNFTFSCYEEMDLIPKDDWDQAIRDKNTFLTYFI